MDEIIMFTIFVECGVHAKPGAPVSPLRLMVGRVLWNGVLVMLILAIASRLPPAFSILWPLTTI